MIQFLSRRFALSERGAGDFVKGAVFTTLFNLALMLQAVFIFIFFKEYLLPFINNTEPSGRGVDYFALLALGFMVVTWVVAVFQYRSTYTIVYDESATRRISLAEKLRKLPLAFFGEKNLSDLTSTIMADNTDLEHTFSHAVPQLFASIASIGLVAVGLFIYDWRLGLSLFWVVPVAASVLLLSKKMQRRNNELVYRQKRDVTAYIQEGIDTVQEIKAYSNSDKYLSELDLKLKDYESMLTRGELITGGLVNSAQGVLKLGIVSVIVTGAHLFATGGTDLFTWLMFLIVASRVFDPVNDVFNNLAALFYLDIRIHRMNEIEAMKIQEGGSDFDPENFDIEFDSVNFSYEVDKPVLNNVSFTAKQGEITALVGPSGGGKTTAVKLAARFWDVNSGKITLGGRDIEEIDPETLLQHYSVVFQDVVLFNASIMENIRIGRRGASDEEVLRVAELAQCDDFVSAMTDGYETVIGENGETLSGGERQRISIARALLKDAPIVLLDEATASLDVENETKIQAGISELVRNKTVLIIAHRMRTVANADKIVVLEDGCVAESGSPYELKLSGGIFAGMVNRQMQVTGGGMEPKEANVS